jgi:hypothetical protein
MENYIKALMLAKTTIESWFQAVLDLSKPTMKDWSKFDESLALLQSACIEASLSLCCTAGWSSLDNTWFELRTNLLSKNAPEGDYLLACKSKNQMINEWFVMENQNVSLYVKIREMFDWNIGESRSYTYLRVADQYSTEYLIPFTRLMSLLILKTENEFDSLPDENWDRTANN